MENEGTKLEPSGFFCIPGTKASYFEVDGGVKSNHSITETSKWGTVPRFPFVTICEKGVSKQENKIMWVA